MSEHPKPENYDSDSDFLDAMADHYGIDRRMLRHIPIPKMSTHDDDTCPHLVRANLLEAENARLKEEVHRLEEIVGSDAIDRKYGMCCDASDEHARLKAEVERLKLDYYENKTGEVSATVVQTFNTETGEADYVVSLDDYQKMADMFNAEFLRLKAEVERLTAFTTRTIVPNEELQKQVERLTKAGDNLVYVVTEHPVAEPFVKAWFAAKEGKGQP